MPFRVAARTLLQLGAELISSDAIAFYELIKNAFDAGSKRVDVQVVTCIASRKMQELLEDVHRLEAGDARAPAADGLAAIRSAAAESVDMSAPTARAALHAILAAPDPRALREALEDANSISFSDTGEGMSLNELDLVYLTIGTRSRVEQRARRTRDPRPGSAGERPVLGEKGIGRLSAMRLGRRLLVRTTKQGEVHWNSLKIDWGWFSHDSDALLQDIPVSPATAEPKADSNISGTVIRLTALESEWNRERLTVIANREFSKLTDPFTPRSRFPITLRLNGDVLPVPQLDRALFAAAHAEVVAAFDPRSNPPRLVGRIDYRLQGKQKVFELAAAHLQSVAVASSSVLRRLGPFSLRLYWFNRRLLEQVEGIGDREAVRQLVRDWSGGLMVFRDGFRVNPYGSPDDDWLDIDRSALGASGYKVNRAQLIGKVDLTSEGNPCLIDQTNREGLRDNPEKYALVRLLRYVLIGQLRDFLDEVDEEVRARVPIRMDEIEQRIRVQRKQVETTVKQLVRKYPVLREEGQLLGTIEDSLAEVDRITREASSLAESYQKGHRQLIDLAGVGLMVEFVAHELNRATSHALRSVRSVDASGLNEQVTSTLATLAAQLATLQKRLQVLDPLTGPARQQKERLDVISAVEDVLASHSEQFRRHQIRVHLDVQPPSHAGPLTITLVRGMVVQILENLISNSVYWLGQARQMLPSFRPSIDVVIDCTKRRLQFTDNGPGVPRTDGERVFRPFVTTKPPGEGKGLGLYIAREVARYNGADLYLDQSASGDSDALHTFVLDLEARK